MTNYSLDWAYAYGKPEVSGLFRSVPEDFYVDEDLGFKPEGSGEHVMLHVQKIGDNTAWLAKQIARLAGVNPSDVGYCGLKDRHAVTQQWFSVYFPKGEEPNWSELNTESTKLLEVSRHVRKLRRGSHRRNRFRIVVRELSGDLELLNSRLSQVAERGVPNYFGEQRFGIDAGNLDLAQQILVEGRKINNRQRRGLVMSAARSYLFNTVLSTRVSERCWQSVLEGDVLEDGRSTGPMWGRGRLASSADCQVLELRVLEALQSWRDGLEHVGLNQERRLLNLLPDNMQWQLESNQLVLSFELPPGSYATAVLRELCLLENVSQPQVVV